MALNEPISLNIRFALAVLPAVYFNGQSRIKRNKIQNVWAERKLSAKFHAELIASKCLPKFSFGVGRLGSELAGELGSLSNH